MQPESRISSVSTPAVRFAVVNPPINLNPKHTYISTIHQHNTMATKNSPDTDHHTPLSTSWKIYEPAFSGLFAALSAFRRMTPYPEALVVATSRTIGKAVSAITEDWDEAVCIPLDGHMEDESDLLTALTVHPANPDKQHKPLPQSIPPGEVYVCTCCSQQMSGKSYREHMTARKIPPLCSAKEGSGAVSSVWRRHFDGQPSQPQAAGKPEDQPKAGVVQAEKQALPVACRPLPAAKPGKPEAAKPAPAPKAGRAPKAPAATPPKPAPAAKQSKARVAAPAPSGEQEPSKGGKKLPGAPAYTLYPDGRLFHDGKQVKSGVRAGRTALCAGYKTEDGKSTTLIIAPMVAKLFASGYKGQKLAFADGDPTNCRLDNLVWE